MHITELTILPLLLCHVSHEPLRPVHSLCSWSHCGHLHGNISSFVRFCRPMKLNLFIFFNTPTISDSEYYCNLCILRIFFSLASLKHSHLGSVHPWVLSSFKTYMRIFYFNQHSSYLKKSVWGGTLSLSPGLSPLSSWWWSRIFQDVGWEIMCLFYCNEVPREQEIGFACEPDFFTCSNPNS